MNSKKSAKKTVYDLVQNLDLEGKVYLVTGAYSGLGSATTKALLSAKAKVIIAGRNPETQSKFSEELLANSDLNLEKNQIDASHTLDLADLGSVRDFANYVAKEYDEIHCLINNAGVMNTPAGQTKNGFEIQMGTNVIGHFLLAKILAPTTKRQVWLSSKGHIRFGSPRINLEAINQVNLDDYHPRKRYQQSKLGSILLAKQFGIEYPHLKSVAVHPGLVQTKLGRHANFLTKVLFLISNPKMAMNIQTPEEGAATQVMLATKANSEIENGAYYADCKVIKESESARNLLDAKSLYDYCDTLTQAYLE